LFGFALILHMGLVLLFIAPTLVMPIGAGIQRRDQREIEDLRDWRGVVLDIQWLAY
jgi:hypothetical protein